MTTRRTSCLPLPSPPVSSHCSYFKAFLVVDDRMTSLNHHHHHHHIHLLLHFLLLLRFPASTHSLAHRRINPNIRAASRALEHLHTCCSVESCRDAHFSDLLSGLWNFAALSKETHAKIYHRTIEIAEECNIRNALSARLDELRRTCTSDGQCALNLIILEFQGKRWNVKISSPTSSSTSSTHTQLNASVFALLTKSTSGWTPDSKFATNQDLSTRAMSTTPSASTVDRALVVGWAALRSGNAMRSWSDIHAIMTHVSNLRLHYARHLPGALSTRHVKAMPIIHVGRPEKDGTISKEATRDLVW